MTETCHTVYTSISNREWIRGEQVGSGGMSKVYNATCAALPGEYVIKIGNLVSEMMVYTRFCKKDQLDAHGMACLPEYVDGGVNPGTNEQFLILKKYNPSYSTKERVSDGAFIRITRDTLTALKYLHTNGYVHNDIKPSNILYDGNRFILCDFGVTMKWRKTGYAGYSYKHFCGTKIFAGLDMHIAKKGPSPRSDIDSLVLCMVRWCQLKLPWSKQKSLAQIQDLKLAFFKNPHPTLAQCSSLIKRNLILAFINHNKDVPFDDLPPYETLFQELDAAEARISSPCCDTCLRLEETRDKLMLSSHKTARAAIRALKFLELWEI